MPYDAQTPAPFYDAGTELRKALGLPEPNFSAMRGTYGYFGGFRNREDQEQFEELDRLADEREAREEALMRGEVG